MSFKSLKILVVVESLNENASSGAKANLALVKNLHKAGFQLKVYHYTRKEIFIEEIDCVSVTENRNSALFFLSRAERYLRYLTKVQLNKPLEKKFGFSFTLKNDRNSLVTALRKEKGMKPDWVLTLSQGGSFRPHHALLKIPEWHQKWIAYIHDPYPMHWYPKPYTWHEPGWKEKEKFMREVAVNCKYAAFPSQLLMEWMGTKEKKFSKKGIVIPHQLTQDLSIDKKSTPSILNENEFNLVHAGNLLQARNPRGLIEGFKLFLQNKPGARANFVQIGPSFHYRDYLKKQSELEPKIRFFDDSRPFKEVLEIQSRASVNIILEANADFSPFLPGKFPHCIKANKPILVLGPKKSEVRRLLGEDDPFCAEITNTNKIAEIIAELYKNWKKGHRSLDRKDLENYLSEDYLQEIFSTLPKL